MAIDPYDSRDTQLRAEGTATEKGWTRTARRREGDGFLITWERGTRSVTIVFDADREPVSMSVITATGRANFHYGIRQTLLVWLNRG